jgi:hypothetical protein
VAQETHVRPEGLRKLKFCDLIGNRTRDFPSCITVPQLGYRVHPLYYCGSNIVCRIRSLVLSSFVLVGVSSVIGKKEVRGGERERDRRGIRISPISLAC